MTKNLGKKWNFEAGTVEEAIEKALDVLECAREEIGVEVVSEEKRGLFGMDGAEPAKIIVRLKSKEK